MPLIDFDEVKRRVSLSQVLSMMGRLPRMLHKTQFNSFCPNGCHGSRACAFNLAKNVFHCFKCKKGGNQLDLYMLVRKMNVHQAAADMCSRAGISLPTRDDAPPACLREPRESAPVTREEA